MIKLIAPLAVELKVGDRLALRFPLERVLFFEAESDRRVASLM